VPATSGRPSTGRTCDGEAVGVTAADGGGRRRARIRAVVR